MPENKGHPSKRSYAIHRVRRSVRALIGPKKRDTTLQREKAGKYFGHIWLCKELYETVSFLARANKCSKKFVTEQALRAGLAKILAEAIEESNQRQAAMREQGLQAKPTAVVRELVRLARSKGLSARDYF